MTLLQRIGTGRPLNADGLANELNVSRRTVFRDLSLLRKAGVKIRIDGAEKGYEVNSTQHRLSALTDEEVLVLLRNAKASALPRSSEQDDKLERAICQLGATLDDDVRAKFQHMSQMAVTFEDSSGRDYAEDIDRLLEAVVKNLYVSVTLKENTQPFESTIRIIAIRVRLHIGRWVLDGVRLRDHAKLRLPLGLIDNLVISDDSLATPLASHLRDWTRPDVTFRQGNESPGGLF